MTRGPTQRSAWLAGAAAALAAGAAHAIERFPPPEFERHALPVTTTPGPRAPGLEWLDVAVLAAALAVAAWLVLRRRSRAGVVGLGLFSLAYFGFYRRGCICPVGSLQNVTLGLADPSYGVPLAVIAFFLLPLAATLLFGRVFCAGVCPLGMIQDIVAVRPLAVPAWLDRPLRLLAPVYLASAVLLAAAGSGFLVCRYDPFVSFFRLSGSGSILLVGGCLLLIGVFVARPYCRYFCPYGVLLGWMSRLARRHATITPDRCIRCRLCEDSCPFGAIRTPTPAAGAIPRRAGRRALVRALVVLPLAVAAGAGIGRLAASALSRTHPTVRLAAQVLAEDRATVTNTTVASDAFRNTARPTGELYAEAARLQGRFRHGAPIAGGFVGLVVGAGLVQLSVRRRREDYEPDRETCLSCARCYATCPREHVRLGLIGEAAAEALAGGAAKREGAS